MSDQEVAWTAVTDRYQFSHIDDYDSTLLLIVKSGMLDREIIRKAAISRDAQHAKQLASHEIENAFESFHGSFSNNVDVVATSIRGGLEKNFEYVNLATLHAGVQMLKSIGRLDDAIGLLKFYEDQQENLEFWEPEHDPFNRPIEDEDVKSAIGRRKSKRVDDDFDLARDLLSASKSYNHDLIYKIADRINAADLKALIVERSGADMRRLISAGLEYQRIGNASDDMKKIVAVTKEAIGLLAQESPLNATRARKYGVMPS